MNDFKELKVGTILDIITTRANDVYEAELKAEEKKKNKNETVRMANKNDDIMSFF